MMAAKPKAAVAHASTCNIQGCIQGCIVASVGERLHPYAGRLIAINQCPWKITGAQKESIAIAESTVLRAPTAMGAAVTIRSLLITSPPLIGGNPSTTI